MGVFYQYEGTDAGGAGVIEEVAQRAQALDATRARSADAELCQQVLQQLVGRHGHPSHPGHGPLGRNQGQRSVHQSGLAHPHWSRNGRYAVWHSQGDFEIGDGLGLAAAHVNLVPLGNCLEGLSA